MITLSECTRPTLCVDCDNEEFYDCEHCDFIREFDEEMRREYDQSKST